MDVQGFHHVAIQVHDLELTARFWRDLVGLQELARHRRPDGSLRSIWLAVPGSNGGFIALEHVTGTPAPSPGFRHDVPGYLMVALRIPRAQREAAAVRFQEAGVPLEHETRWTFYVRDPEGNRLALSHHPED